MLPTSIPKSYKPVFTDTFKTFAPYDPQTNLGGRWATAGPRAFDGKTFITRDKVRRPLTIQEIDADPARMLQHRAPGSLGELTIYSDKTMGPAFETAVVKGGRLHLTARAIPPELQAQAGGRRYMAPSLWVTDGGKERCFLYGYFEATVTFDVGQGAHPAVWLVTPGKWTGELDILEYLGHWWRKGPGHDHYHTSIHLDGNLQKFPGEVSAPINGVTHRFGCLWTKESLVFYLDGVAVRSIDNPGLHEPMYPIINLALGTKWSLQKFDGCTGVIDEAALPASMIIDQMIIAQMK